MKESILNDSETIMKKIKQKSGDSDKLNVEWILNNYKYNSLNEIQDFKEILNDYKREKVNKLEFKRKQI